MACSKVQEAQFILGGKSVYIECADIPQLYNFYTEAQFVPFGQRKCNTEEPTDSPDLIQMLKYFKSSKQPI